MYAPALHEVQAADELAPTANPPVYVPAGHAVQAVEPGARSL